MRNFSSSMTIVYKAIFPAVWLTMFGVGAVAQIATSRPGAWGFVAVALAGLAVFWWLLLPLKTIAVDGDELVIGNFLRTIRVPLSDVVEVEDHRFINPRTMSLVLARPC